MTTSPTKLMQSGPLRSSNPMLSSSELFSEVLAMMTALIFVFSVCPGVASAEATSGNELLEICQSSDDLARRGFCAGYILGLIEGRSYGAAQPLLLGETSIPNDELNKLISIALRACVPDQATLAQQRDVIVGYILAHPETRHESARSLAGEALSGAFPCNLP